jgi:pimeloyl-ACP methyl ester carboxylesterase
MSIRKYNLFDSMHMANPRSSSGMRVPVMLENGDIHINYNCTSANASGPSQPTIWFEADAAHGIVDFLGMQTYLALDHGRNSCSYDPPNFGWSDRLPSSLDNFFDYFNPLLKVLGRDQEDIALVGWGSGAINALMHAIENQNTTKSLAILDASPDGIEWMDAKRKNNWTNSQMLSYRSSDLSSRTSLAETILGLGIPWYVVH